MNRSIIFAARLDFFEKEPLNLDNPLPKYKRVLSSLYAATFTKECLENMGLETAQNVIDFFNGKIEKTKIIKL